MYYNILFPILVSIIILLEPVDVDRFPSLDRSDSLPNSSSDGKRSSTRLQDHNHSSETIFALPSKQIHLNTKHLQTATTPDFMGDEQKKYNFLSENVDGDFLCIFENNTLILSKSLEICARL